MALCFGKRWCLAGRCPPDRLGKQIDGKGRDVIERRNSSVVAPQFISSLYILELLPVFVFPSGPLDFFMEVNTIDAHVIFHLMFLILLKFPFKQNFEAMI